MFVVPEVGIVDQINDKLTFGIGTKSTTLFPSQVHYTWLTAL